MAGEEIKVRGVARRVIAIALIVIGLMLLTSLTPLTVTATIHEPVTGGSIVSDDADAALSTDANQDASDVAIDDFGRVHTVWQSA